MEENAWYENVRRYTEQLVGVRSVSPSAGEIRVAEEVLRLLCADGLGAVYTECGLDPLENDPYGRQNAYAFLRGQSTSTLVLLGHIDTVGTEDYGPLESLALNPSALAAHLTAPSATAEEAQDWMFGRGVGDMKSGVAINIALMRHLAQQALTSGEDLPLALSVVMLATPDEENESAGVLQAVRFLLRLRERYNLTYLGALNTDYATERYPGDPQRYVYAGSIGKLLPSFLCIGRESHAADPFHGVDANLLAAELIRDLSMNDDLCDAVDGLLAAPPVTLHAADLKTRYDVQLPFATYFYLNVLTLTSSPGALLDRLCQRANAALSQALARIDAAEMRWRAVSGERQREQPRTGNVLTYAALYAETVQQLGEERVRAELAAEWARWQQQDQRERSLRLVYRLWSMSGKQGPAVVIYYSPPYYPHVAGVPGALREAVEAIVAAHPEAKITIREYFPYLSDMSYLRLESNDDPAILRANMPTWQEDEKMYPGAYRLPLEEIQRLGLPAINWGPHGCGAHQRDERVLMSYSFGTLPQLLYETIEYLARHGT